MPYLSNLNQGSGGGGGGSGGAGVIPIGPDTDLDHLKDLIEESKQEFFAKFMKNRDPYPYTIQEIAEFSVITTPWAENENQKHTFVHI